MKNVTLKQFRYFEALARYGHFGRAAEACAISQPALSVQIKEFEESLGMVLFERQTRQVRLSPFGEEIAPRIREVLHAVEDMGDLARARKGGLAGPLRLGVIPTIAPYLLPSVIGLLTHRFPALELHVRETLTPRLIREVRDGRIDAAILALPIDEPGLNEVPIFEEEFVLVRPLKDAGKPVPNGEALARMRLLLLEEGHCFRDQALSFCNMRSALPREGLDGSSLATLVQLVGAGIGVTLIPEMAVAVETRSAPVAVSRFSASVPKRQVGMIWRAHSPMGTHLSRIADCVSEAAKGLDAG